MVGGMRAVVRLTLAVLFAAPALSSAADRGFRAPPIVLVVADAKTIKKYGPLPWSRARHADVIRRLTRAGAKAVALTFYFRDGHKDKGDRSLIEAVKKNGHVHVEMIRTETPVGWQPTDDWITRHALPVLDPAPKEMMVSEHAQIPFEELALAAHGVGDLDVIVGENREFRALPLLFTYRGRTYPSLALRLFLDTQGLEGQPLAIEHRKDLVLGKLRITLDDHAWVHVDLTSPGAGYPTYSYYDLLNDRVSSRKLKGAVVFVGATTPDQDVQTAMGSKSALEFAADQLAQLYRFAADAAGR